MKNIKLFYLLFALISLSNCDNEISYTESIPKREMVILNSEDTCYSYFNLNKLEVNGIEVFKLSKNDVIQKLGLIKGRVEYNQIEDYYYTEKGKSYIEFDDLLNRIFIIEVIDSSIIFSNPSLSIGISEDKIRMSYPELYKQRSTSSLYGKDTFEVTLNDCRMNRLRCFLYQGKIKSITYWADDDPILYEEFEK